MRCADPSRNHIAASPHNPDRLSQAQPLSDRLGLCFTPALLTPISKEEARTQSLQATRADLSRAQARHLLRAPPPRESRGVYEAYRQS
jgi:hypothetical protein